jgi:hypothetical protein
MEIYEDDEVAENVTLGDFLTDLTDSAYQYNGISKNYKRALMSTEAAEGGKESLHEILGTMGFYCGNDYDLNDDPGSPVCISRDVPRQRVHTQKPSEVPLQPCIKRNLLPVPPIPSSECYRIASLCAMLFTIIISIYTQMLYVGAWDDNRHHAIKTPYMSTYNNTDFVDRDSILRFGIKQYILDFPDLDSMDILLIGGGMHFKSIEPFCAHIPVRANLHTIGIDSGQVHGELLRNRSNSQHLKALMAWHEHQYDSPDEGIDNVNTSVSILKDMVCNIIYERDVNISNGTSDKCPHLSVSDVFFTPALCRSTGLSVHEIHLIGKGIMAYLSQDASEISSMITRKEILYDIVMVIAPLQHLINNFTTLPLLLEIKHVMKQASSNGMETQSSRLLFIDHLSHTGMDYQQIHTRGCSIGMVPMGQVSLRINEAMIVEWTNICKKNLYFGFLAISHTIGKYCDHFTKLNQGKLISSLVTLQTGDMRSLERTCHTQSNSLAIIR